MNQQKLEKALDMAIDARLDISASMLKFWASRENQITFTMEDVLFLDDIMRTTHEHLQTITELLKELQAKQTRAGFGQGNQNSLN